MSRPIRRLVYAVALFVLALPASVAAADDGTAQARPYAGDPVLSGYLEVAARYWNQPAPTCHGPDGAATGLRVLLYDDPDPGVAARAQTPGCEIYLDSDYFPAPPDPVTCTVIVHEWGHLLGYGHSPNPHDVMYETPTEGVPECAALGEHAPKAKRAKRGKRAKRHVARHRRHAKRGRRGHAKRGHHRKHTPHRQARAR